MKKVLAISSVLLGVVFLAGCGQQPVIQTQPTTPAPVAQAPAQPVATQPAPATLIQENVYTNAQYGFQLTLPKGWENYKPIVNETTGSKNVVAYVYIDLPTSDKTWPGDTDPKTGKSMMGYASMFAVTVWSTNGYNAELKRCKTESDPSCPGSNVMSAKSDKYVFAISGPQAMPDDLLKSIADGYIETIGQSFRLTK